VRGWQTPLSTARLASAGGLCPLHRQYSDPLWSALGLLLIKSSAKSRANRTEQTASKTDETILPLCPMMLLQPA
jgi:hypothetical protein